jgi:hypothetical protein
MEERIHLEMLVLNKFLINAASHLALRQAGEIFAIHMYVGDILVTRLKKFSLHLETVDPEGLIPRYFLVPSRLAAKIMFATIRMWCLL